MIGILWNCLWRTNEDIKSVLILTPFRMRKWIVRNSLNLSVSGDSESDVDLASRMVDAPAEHSSSLSPITENGDGGKNKAYSKRQLIGLVAGPVLFVLMLLMPIPAGMSPGAQKMAAVVFLMAIWWMCEALPIPVTSLLPIPLFPLLGIMSTSEAAAPYANQLIFLFMGGFIIALAMQRWNLHRRVAMNIVKIVGFSPKRLVFGFMSATAVLSAFVSNTATTVMMLPIGLAIITHVVNECKREGLDTTIDLPPEQFNFGLNLMLGIAYAASIGGISTLIGTPPNTVLAGYLQKTYGYEITYVGWLKVGVPLVVVMLPLCWLWLIRINPMKLERVPGGRDLINEELRKIGTMSPGERWTALVFGLTAIGWIFRKQFEFLFPDPTLVTDATFAMAGALILFVIPLNLKNRIFVMDWQWARKLPWGVLILFGGGLSMAEGFNSSGLAEWLGMQVVLLGDYPVLIMILAVTTLMIFLTELTSNTATTAMAMPILSAVAICLGQNPLLLIVPAAVAASCAFMLPVATPPNAIVFGSGYVSIPQMAKSGLGMNIVGILLVLLFTYALIMPIFDVVFGQLPDWVTTTP